MITSDQRKFQNQVKSTNERIAEAARQYGRDSEIYKEYEKYLTKTLPPEAIGYSKSGNIKIKQGFKNLEKLNKGTIEDIRDNVRTTGQYTKQLRKEFTEEYGGGKPTKEDLQDFSKIKGKVKEAAQDGTVRLILSKGGAGNSKRNRRLTYAELNDLLDKYSQSESESEAQTVASEFVSEHFYTPNYEDINKLFGDEVF